MSVSFTVVREDEQISLTSQLADEIWKEHYADIITQNQIQYMLDRFQSPAAIKEQVRKDGYAYYLMEAGGEPVGYLAFKPEDGKLFLSKLYVRRQHRGNGYASRAFEFLAEWGEARGLSAIWLTVNRNNRGSIAVYEKRGFRPIRTQVADIGNGFVMDDYIMEKKLNLVPNK